MASSNKHWPSMFKSKPCNPHHQWQHDLNSSLLSGCHINPYTSGVEERSPEPKPRWNPKPEQIRILEAIFNSGMVNPPRDEIRKIRAQLQEYGQVGDANVFYWFQNRKSRSKHKNRQLPKNQKSATTRTTTTKFATTNCSTIPATATPNSIISNPSSSSGKSSSKFNNCNKFTNNTTGFTLGSCSSNNLLDQLSYSSTASVNQTAYDHNLVQQHDQPFMFPALQHLNFTATQGFPGFTDIQTQTMQQQNMMTSNNTTNNNLQVNGSNVGPCTEFLFSELINDPHGGSSDPKLNKDAEDEEKLMMMKLGYATAPPSTTSPVLVDHLPAVPAGSTAMPLHSTLQNLQAADDSGGSSVAGPMKSTVFINDVAFEVNSGPFHVREAFGNDAVLLHSTGQPVLTDEWGITLQPLQHGAFYYLI